MEFYNVDSYDHFQDMTIFWVTLLDIPIELKNRAALIDGDNYDEKGFGVCVAFDTETQKYELVVDMDKDEARTVYYIDNDGDKRWFACEVPEELAEHIFSECQQILNFQKIEDGYEIKESVQFVDNSGFVLAEKPNSDRPYITAYFFTTDLGQRYYSKRKSFCNRNEAAEDFSKRIEYQKQFRCIKSDQSQADKHRKKDAKQVRKSTNRPKRKRR